MADQCETPMADHVKRFFELLKVPGAIVRVDTPNPLGYDTASFGEGFAAALRATPSLAGEDVEGLCTKLDAACVGHPHAKIPWPHRLLHEARDMLRSLDTLVGIRTEDLATLSSRVEEAERENIARKERIEYYITRTKQLVVDNDLAHAALESAETRSAELARALNELIIAADSLAITANLSQADREIDRALSALAGHDAAIHTGDDDE